MLNYLQKDVLLNCSVSTHT